MSNVIWIAKASDVDLSIPYHPANHSQVYKQLLNPTLPNLCQSLCRNPAKAVRQNKIVRCMWKRFHITLCISTTDIIQVKGQLAGYWFTQYLTWHIVKPPHNLNKIPQFPRKDKILLHGQRWITMTFHQAEINKKWQMISAYNMILKPHWLVFYLVLSGYSTHLFYYKLTNLAYIIF